MTTQTYGSILGAGTQIREKNPGAPIRPSALGWVGYAGMLKRGPVGELIVMLNQDEMDRKVGRYHSDSLCPDSMIHYFENAAGAGGVLAVRITDGTEAKARYYLYMRRDAKTQLGYLDAHNGGAWAGKRKRATGEASLLGDIGTITLDTGVGTWETDQWVGATLELAGVPNSSYTVVANDDAGVLTVSADADMAADIAAGDPTNLRWYLDLENGEDYMSVTIRDGDSDPINKFSIDIVLSDGTSLTFSDLTLDDWVDRINTHPENYYVTATQTFNGAHVSSARPANHYSEFDALTATTLTASIFEYEINGTGDHIVTLPSTTDAMDAQTITLTFSDPTNFTAVSDVYGALGSGVVDSTFTPDIKWAPSILVSSDDVAMTAADTITIVYKPLEADALIGGYVYPDPVSQPTLRYRITDNTHKVITVEPGSDMLTDVAPTFGVAATGSITAIAGASLLDDETFVLPRASATNEDITFFFDLGGAVTVADDTTIQVAVTGGDTDAVVATKIKAAIVGVTGIKYDPGTIVGALIPLAYTEETADANQPIVETVANAGFIVTGMTGGVTPSDLSFRAEFAAQFSGGRDGHAGVADSHYIQQAWSLLNSPFNDIRDRGYGLVKFATPGVTATAVQQAGVTYVSGPGDPKMPPHQYRYEVPIAYTSETSIVDYVENTLGRSKYAVASAHGRCYVTDPENDAILKEVSTTGMIHGREARIAADNSGYHKPGTDQLAILPQIVELGTGNTRLNEEYLNPRGIQVIKVKNARFVIWGNRTLTEDGLWSMKSQRELMSFYEHVLSQSLDWIIFQLNDKTLWSNLAASLRTYFLSQYRLRALRGDSFDDACVIKVDSENNPDSEIEAGNLHASIGLTLAAGVERVIVTMSRNGINTSA